MSYEVLDECNSCGEHTVPYTRDDVAEIVAERFTEGEYGETDGVAVYRLRDGGYVVAEVWSDTTGHG